jgi:hypothetical protein
MRLRYCQKCKAVRLYEDWETDEFGTPCTTMIRTLTAIAMCEGYLDLVEATIGSGGKIEITRVGDT